MAQHQLITAREAASRLGVKRATLYTYVSRGWLARWPAADGESRYARAEVDELKHRADAHKGHGAAAGEALRWGPPVLESAITSIDADGPNYRGEPALTLAERGVGWERAAELLWSGALPRSSYWPDPWPVPDVPEAPPLRRMPAIVALLSIQFPALDRSADAELDRARRLARTLALALGGPGVTAAASLAAARPEATAAIEAALVLCADHELNASAFAARIAAAADADLFACISAALAAFSGSRHGGAPERVSALLAECGRLGVKKALSELAAGGKAPPGLGHPLYPEGDPRAAMLLALAKEAPGAGASIALELAEALAEGGYPPPNLDFGLAALMAGWGLPPEHAGVVFAVGRLAGWVAHVLEQRQQPGLLRPRASYVGR